MKISGIKEERKMTVLLTVLFNTATILVLYALIDILSFIAVALMFLVGKRTKYIKPAFKAHIWGLKHPIKEMKMLIDMVVVASMILDDKIFKLILKQKYKSNERRLKRVQYENEREKEWIEDTMKSFGNSLQHTMDCLDIDAEFIYTPRRVVYKELDEVWQISS